MTKGTISRFLIDSSNAENLDGETPYMPALTFSSFQAGLRNLGPGEVYIPTEDETLYAPARPYIWSNLQVSAWTTEKPYADGFYWIRDRGFAPPIDTIIKVTYRRAAFPGSECTVLVDNLGDDWLFSGPIRPPE